MPPGAGCRERPIDHATQRDIVLQGANHIVCYALKDIFIVGVIVLVRSEVQPYKVLVVFAVGYRIMQLCRVASR
jgi:hypothetical protein